MNCLGWRQYLCSRQKTLVLLIFPVKPLRLQRKNSPGHPFVIYPSVMSPFHSERPHNKRSGEPTGLSPIICRWVSLLLLHGIKIPAPFSFFMFHLTQTAHWEVFIWYHAFLQDVPLCDPNLSSIDESRYNVQGIL